MKCFAGRGVRRFLLKLSLAAFSAVLSLVVFDRLMGLAGFPRDFVQLAHPPNYHRPVRNIEASYEFRTNSQGLRSRESPLAKPAGTFRLFVSGDSFTEGELIADGDRWSDLLEARFDRTGRRFEVINGGIAGSGPMTYTGLFRRTGVRYEPDFWLIMVFPNDVQDTPLRIEKLSDGIFRQARTGRISRLVSRFVPHIVARIKAYLQFRDRSEQANLSDLVGAMRQQVGQGAVAQDRFDRWLERVPEELIEAADQGQFNAFSLSQGLLLPRLWVDSLELESEDARTRWTNMRQILAESLQAAQSAGIPAAIVYAPVRFQYDPNSVAGQDPWSLAGAEVRPEWVTAESALPRELANLAAELAVPYLDLTKRFRELTPEEARATTFRHDLHWNVQGHRLVAGWLAEWLESIRAVPSADDSQEKAAR